MKPHPTALVDPGASVADDVEIGPFCVIGPGVRIGAGTRLAPRVSVQGDVAIGKNNVLHAHVTIGKPAGGKIEIGDGNIFRESAHVAAATGAATRIGSHNRLGAWAGVSSGATVGSDVRVGAFSMIGENDIVEDEARIEGQCVIDANRRIGRASRIRSQVPIGSDVLPYMVFDGNPSTAQAVNPARRTEALEAALAVITGSGLSWAQAGDRLLETPATPEVKALAEFLKTAKPPEADVE